MPMTRTATLGDHRFNRIGLGTNRLTDTPENHDFLRGAVEAGAGPHRHRPPVHGR